MYVLELYLSFQENSNDYCTHLLEHELLMCELNHGLCACLFPPQAEKAVLDVGETLVGSYRSIEVPLVNNSPCPVSFCLSVQQALLDEEPIYDPETVPSGILICGFLCGHFMYVHDIHQFSVTEYLLLACAFVSKVNEESSL